MQRHAPRTRLPKAEAGCSIATLHWLDGTATTASVPAGGPQAVLCGERWFKRTSRQGPLVYREVESGAASKENGDV